MSSLSPYYPPSPLKLQKSAVCRAIQLKLCTNMRAEDVTDTIELVLTALGCDQVTVRHKPHLLRPSHALQANHCRTVENGSC
jgi:hypothetical protein